MPPLAISGPPICRQFAGASGAGDGGGAGCFLVAGLLPAGAGCAGAFGFGLAIAPVAGRATMANAELNATTAKTMAVRPAYDLIWLPLI